MDRSLSRAVLVYFSVGRKPRPSRDPAAVQAAFGDAALDLVPRIKAIDEEIYAKDADWRLVSYETALSGVESLLREQHPELDDEAVQAFVNAFAFEWK